MLVAVTVCCAFLAWSGERGARARLGQFRVLAEGIQEPRSLIPDLGAKIRAEFSEDREQPLGLALVEGGVGFVEDQ